MESGKEAKNYHLLEQLLQDIEELYLVLLKMNFEQF